MPSIFLEVVPMRTACVNCVEQSEQNCTRVVSNISCKRVTIICQYPGYIQIKHYTRYGLQTPLQNFVISVWIGIMDTTRSACTRIAYYYNNVLK